MEVPVLFLWAWGFFDHGWRVVSVSVKTQSFLSLELGPCHHRIGRRMRCACAREKDATYPHRLQASLMRQLLR